MDNDLQQTALALRSEWDLELPETLSEDALLQLLADRIVAILQKGPEAFYQLMYRLDISERKLNAAVQQDDVARQIARLIYDRQLEKMRSREAHRRSRASGDPDLNW